MNSERYNEIIENLISDLKDKIIKKAEEYSLESDRLETFNEASNISSESRMKCLWNFMLKHIVSFKRIVYTMDKDRNYIPDESFFKEKTEDIIIFMFLSQVLYYDEKEILQKSKLLDTVLPSDELLKDSDITNHNDNIKKWNINLSKYKDGVYDGSISVPNDINEFKGFKELFGFEIKEVNGYLSFYGCYSLTSVSNLPEYIGGHLSFRGCTSLTSIGKMPSVVKMGIITEDCPFFEGMDEEQVRKKYGIRKE